MKIPSDRRIERQIVYNAELEIIMSVDSPDGVYADPIGHFDKIGLSAFGEDAINWYDCEQINPFFELLILRDPLGLYSYKVSLISDYDVSVEQWRSIRDKVFEELSDFENEKSGTEKRLLFLEKNDDPRFRVILSLEHLFKHLMELLLGMKKRSAKIHEYVGKFGLSDEIFQSALDRGISNWPIRKKLALEILKRSDDHEDDRQSQLIVEFKRSAKKLIKEIRKLKKEKVPIEEFVEKLGLPEESVQKALDNEKWDWLNQKKFALEILRNSKQPREMSRLQLGARLKAKYDALMNELKEMEKRSAPIEEYATKYGLSKEIVEKELQNVVSSWPVRKSLALRILKTSYEAKKLGVYHKNSIDDIVRRSPKGIFPKRERSRKDKRLRG
jgi:hypothetical protein